MRQILEISDLKIGDVLTNNSGKAVKVTAIGNTAVLIVNEYNGMFRINDKFLSQNELDNIVEVNGKTIGAE